MALGQGHHQINRVAAQSAASISIQLKLSHKHFLCIKQYLLLLDLYINFFVRKVYQFYFSQAKLIIVKNCVDLRILKCKNQYLTDCNLKINFINLVLLAVSDGSHKLLSQALYGIMLHGTKIQLGTTKTYFQPHFSTH